jgi:hypothetical protein
MSQATIERPDNVISLHAVATGKQTAVDKQRRDAMVRFIDELRVFAESGELTGLVICTDGTGAIGGRAGAYGTLRDPSALALATAKLQKFLWTFVSH